MRVKRGFKDRRRRNNFLKASKGYFGSRNRLFRMANMAVHHAWRNAWIGRKLRKRDMRKLWITRINAAARLNGTSYSRFMGGLNKANVVLDRKILSDIAIADPAGFAAVVAISRAN